MDQMEDLNGMPHQNQSIRFRKWEGRVVVWALMYDELIIKLLLGKGE